MYSIHCSTTKWKKEKKKKSLFTATEILNQHCLTQLWCFIAPEKLLYHYKWKFQGRSWSFASYYISINHSPMFNHTFIWQLVGHWGKSCCLFSLNIKKKHIYQITWRKTDSNKSVKLLYAFGKYLSSYSCLFSIFLMAAPSYLVINGFRKHGLLISLSVSFSFSRNRITSKVSRWGNPCY